MGSNVLSNFLFKFLCDDMCEWHIRTKSLSNIVYKVKQLVRFCSGMILFLAFWTEFNFLGIDISDGQFHILFVSQHAQWP